MFNRESVSTSLSRRCVEMMLSLDRRQRREVMAQLCFDRIGQKQEFITNKYHDSEDWNEITYFMLLRGLDIGANRKAYESLANLLSYRYINLVGHHRQSIEALLLGCAGLLSRLADVMPESKEVTELVAIYEYESHKYNLPQMAISEWQFAGTRGNNHPIVKLLQIANLLSQHVHLLDSFLNCSNRQNIETLFCNSDIPRWAYRFLMQGSLRGSMSREKAHILGINVVAQMQICYSEYTMRSDLDTRGIELLESLPAEDNIFIRRWANMGIVAESALESQALLQLSKSYCTSMACDKCLFRRFVDAK